MIIVRFLYFKPEGILNIYKKLLAMANKIVHAIISGRVQGVFFRDYTQREAINLGLTGWVRNLPDRTVEAVISGNSKSVDQMIDWLHKGSPASQVDHVQVDELDTDDRYSSFEVRY